MPSELTDSREVAAVLARHQAFWGRGAVARPLVSAQPRRGWAAKPYPLRDGEAHDARQITPDDLDIDRLIGDPPPVLEGDLMQALGCAYPAAWLEAVAGCPIYASAYGCVARPAVESLEEALAQFSVEACLASPWLAAMETLQRRLAERAGTRWAVQQLHLRGVIDLLAAYLGEELLCLSVLDGPKKLAVLAERMTALHLAVARREQTWRRPWQDGAVSCWKVYAPGPLLDYQIDASSLFSADVYRTHFARYDQTVLAAFPFTLVHLHSVGLQHLATVLALEAVSAVEINLDREAQLWDQAAMLSACRRVQESGKALLINGELSSAELQEFIARLAPAGLAIDCWHESVGG